MAENKQDESTLLAYERTRLASERTLLSWIRTGITGVGIGIAIDKFLIFTNDTNHLIAHISGQLLIFWGIIIFLFALFSYRHSLQELAVKTGYKSSFAGITFLICMLISICILLFWLLQ